MNSFIISVLLKFQFPLNFVYSVLGIPFWSFYFYHQFSLIYGWCKMDCLLIFIPESFLYAHAITSWSLYFLSTTGCVFFFQSHFHSLCVPIKESQAGSDKETLEARQATIAEPYLKTGCSTKYALVRRVERITVMLKPQTLRGISQQWFGAMYGPIRELFTISAQMLTPNLCWN